MVSGCRNIRDQHKRTQLFLFKASHSDAVTWVRWNERELKWSLMCLQSYHVIGIWKNEVRRGKQKPEGSREVIMESDRVVEV